MSQKSSDPQAISFVSQPLKRDKEFNDEKRTEIHDLLEMLQGNLGKIVHHGKRADSIVKNMLLHSRQISGKPRSVDLNALVEESPNLAYHGARAQKGDFNITLERLFDPTTGEVNLLPEEITRVLLNLISNSFYATRQRKAEGNGGSYEPILTAATKNLGDSVEIRIRDNGWPPVISWTLESSDEMECSFCSSNFAGSSFATKCRSDQHRHE
jgi:signal transduction histidine kinase